MGNTHYVWALVFLKAKQFGLETLKLVEDPHLDIVGRQENYFVHNSKLNQSCMYTHIDVGGARMSNRFVGLLGGEEGRHSGDLAVAGLLRIIERGVALAIG